MNIELLGRVQFVFFSRVWDTLLNIEADSDCFIGPDNGSHLSWLAPAVITDSNSGWILKTVVRDDCVLQ